MGSRGRGRTAKKCRVDALAGVGSNTIAGCQQQAASCDLNMPVSAYCGLEACDSPGRAGRHTPHDVKVDCSIGSDAGNSNDPDAAFEFQHGAAKLSGLFCAEATPLTARSKDGYRQSTEYVAHCLAVRTCCVVMINHFFLLIYLAF